MTPMFIELTKKVAKMKAHHRILLSAALGIIITLLVWPELENGIFPTDPGTALIGAGRILIAVLGVLFISYSLHEITLA